MTIFFYFKGGRLCNAFSASWNNECHDKNFFLEFGYTN